MTTATATPLRSKALAVLREGRLSVVSARSTSALELTELVVRVRSSREGGPSYAVDYLDGVWDCTCRRPQPCAHVTAAQLVSGQRT